MRLTISDGTEEMRKLASDYENVDVDETWKTSFRPRPFLIAPPKLVFTMLLHCIWTKKEPCSL
jgi:hypothetical protein